MNAAQLQAATPARNTTSDVGSQKGDARGDLSGRLSPELVMALSGPVGCGIDLVRKELQQQLENRGYRVVHIKVTEHFSELAHELKVPNQTDATIGEYSRISSFQDLGNDLREVLGEDLGAQIALQAIALDRLNSAQTADEAKEVDPEHVTPKRVAYVIDQLKNPKEVQLLRDVYGNLFFLVGTLSGYERRKRNLMAKRMTEPEAVKLMDRDRAESNKDGRSNRGQQLEKTLKSADFFLRNTSGNSRDLSEQLKRFIDLLHDEPGITPTIPERGMYAAFSAAMRSACLSRQVGAAIVSTTGSLLSTGCNDVPRRGGGLYEYGNGDNRCVHKEGGHCFNDQHKDFLCDEIKSEILKHGVDSNKASDIAKSIRSSTRLKDLIEFSRAVHAEMDALISVSREGGNSVKGAILFTTTYPCHNCARHIVAAGISSVYFIEPYAKSLAIELHDDDIAHDPDEQVAWGESRADGKVAFLNFEGVSPNRFRDLFYSLDGRKDSQGKAIRVTPSSAKKKSIEFIDNYIQLESRIVKRIEDAIQARKNS
ncbi:anti-phage dCTP deaminase [Pseudoxanthomonas kalamensis]|uniref:anti-phage dCTP deaminase n=1 Tax=Pseudoxanthomonas kalamensis TaxID=289483 RepID=UPI001390B838|nr:anti-phage dCTP deaminase [Pseudoxanthomonas kalamensis]